MAPLSSLTRSLFNHQRSFCFSLFLFMTIVIMRLSLQRFMIPILLNSWFKLIATWGANRIFLSWFKWWLLQSCWNFLAKFRAFESSSMSNLSWIRFQLSPTIGKLLMQLFLIVFLTSHSESLETCSERVVWTKNFILLSRIHCEEEAKTKLTKTLQALHDNYEWKVESRKLWKPNQLLLSSRKQFYLSRIRSFTQLPSPRAAKR